MPSAHREPAQLTSTQRLFFALWPDAGTRTALATTAQAMRDVLRGHMTRAESIHLTLAFLGDVDVQDLNRLLDPPREVTSSPFLLTLDAWGCWPRNGIGWAMPAQPPRALLDLAGNLERWLRGAGFSPERRAFVPHVTLVRKAKCVEMPQPMTPVAWSVREFVLVQSTVSQRGSFYEILQRWPL